MTEEFNESTRVMPAGGEPPIDRTMVATAATAAPSAGATQMGGTLACPVCTTTNPGLETYCVECGFLLTSTPGALEAAEEPEEEGVELVESASGRRFRLRRGVNTVGRESSDILLLDGTVSRRHAEVTLEDGALTVTDLGSTNGTQVDGNRIEPNVSTPIRPGTIVRFGNATLALPGPVDSMPAEPTIVASPSGFDQTLVAQSPTMGEEAVAAPNSVPTVDESGAVARLRGASVDKDIIFRPGKLTIGRRPGNDVVLADSFVSGNHAEVTCDEFVCHVTDLGSTNGTTVNGVKLEPHQAQLLVDGDEVQLGQATYLFETVKSAQETQEESPESEEPVEVEESTESVAGDEDA